MIRVWSFPQAVGKIWTLHKTVANSKRKILGRTLPENEVWVLDYALKICTSEKQEHHDIIYVILYTLNSHSMNGSKLLSPKRPNMLVVPVIQQYAYLFDPLENDADM